METITATPKEIIRKIYAALRVGDLEGVRQFLSPDAVWVYHGTDDIPYSGTYRGVEEIVSFLKSFHKHIDVLRLLLKRFIAEGSTVVVQGSGIHKIRKNAVLLRQSWVQVFLVEEGRVRRVDEYANTAQVANQFVKA